MKRVVKWAGVAVAGLVVVGVVAAGFVCFRSHSLLNRSWAVDPAPVPMTDVLPPGAGYGNGNGNGMTEAGSGDAEARVPGAGDVEKDPMAELLAWGKHIATTRGCQDCHGEDLGGGVFADAMPVMRLAGPNLTPGGVGSAYSDADWVRAIRHGVGPDGRGLLLMPSDEYYYLGDRDLAALVTYLKSLPPVARELPESRLGPAGRALLVAGKFPLPAATRIDHEGPRPVAPPKGATVAYGEYLAMGACTGCHGPTLSGGPIPGAPPEWPPAANITPDPETGIGSWSRENFMAAMTRGVRPDGRQIEPRFMPWPNLARLEPDEKEALWLYLQTVEAKPFGER